MLFSYLAHKKACAAKQKERRARINELPAQYKEPITPKDATILAKPVSSLVESVQAGKTDPRDILMAYSKQALKAHAETNCLTEVMIHSAETWAEECNAQGPLAGIPVSLKDMIGIAGWDTNHAYSAWSGKPVQKDSAIVRLLRDAGAVPYVKTTVPITLMSGETYSDLFGRTTNPHKKTHTCGGSSGGEGALLAFGGSRIGIGSDVGGSVRIPAHFSGVYSIKASVGRFIGTGWGQEGVPAVYSPMARTLEDLETVWKAIVSMKPWEYDTSCLVMPWKEFEAERPLRWGVMWDDGVVAPSPACNRALETVVTTLQKHGHEVVSINPPSPYEGLKIASQLLIADGGKEAVAPVRTGETMDAGYARALRMATLPRWLQKLFVWYVRNIKRDELYAGLIEGFHEKTVADFWALGGHRNDYRRRWFEMWEKEGIDFILTVPNSLPALPHNGMDHGFKALGYTLLLNLLDNTAGVLPVTHVDSVKDRLPDSPKFKPRNSIEKVVYRMYDSVAMHGLPIGVQVIGRRLEEEKVLAGMKTIEHLLRKDGIAYELLNETLDVEKPE